jgi:hypothetical protein
MTEHQTSRTLVKSAPELWAECSDAASLARHLGAFGEIRITKLEPETTVAWEGTAASGTVRLEPSGWGTRVTLTLAGDQAPRSEEPAGTATDATNLTHVETAASEPAAAPQEAAGPPARSEAAVPGAPPREGFFARLMARLRGASAPVEPPVSPAPVEPHVSPAPDEPHVSPAPVEPHVAAAPDEPPVAAAPDEPPASPAPVEPQSEAVLAAALDSLGRAHHRPYSRA